MAYVFQFDDGRWVEEATLTPSDSTERDQFGQAVGIDGDAIGGDRVVIGAQGDDEIVENSGAAYAFRYDSEGEGAWVFEAKMKAVTPRRSDNFGWSVSVSGRVFLIGAPNRDAAGVDSGAGFVFAPISADENGDGIPDECECHGDLDGSGAVDFGDVLAILSAWGNKGGPEYLDGNGVLDFGDLLIVLAAWGPCE